MSKISKLEELLNIVKIDEQDDKLINMAVDYLSKAFRTDKTNPNLLASDVIDVLNRLVAKLGISDANKVKIYRSLISRSKEIIMGKEEKKDEELEVIADPSKQEKNDNLDMLLPIGKHNHIPDGEFDPRELETGTRIELEHTDDLNVARAICKDHLAECPDYYTRLLKMEKECELEEK